MGTQLSIPVEDGNFPDKNSKEALLKIDFMENWNGKLNNQVFSTIRPKHKGYVIGDKYAVYLNDTFFCYVKPIFTSIMSLDALIKGNYHLLDTGRNEKLFMELMREFYDKKTWWKDKQTEMNYILLERIEQLNLFE